MFIYSSLTKSLVDEPAYRLNQAKKLVFQNFIESWEEATVFSKPLRARLEREVPLKIAAKETISLEKDTVKATLKLNDGLLTESVLIRHSDGRNTICVSCQVGCPLGCLFCATGKLGLKRSLEFSEILAQVLFFARLLHKENKKITNIVFMGMGEPFLNYDAVLSAVRTLHDPEGFNLGWRNMSISTSGIAEKIRIFAEEKIPVNLAISLHAPNDRLRRELMPIANRYSIKEILAAVDYYLTINRRRVMFEYLMIDGVNDSLKEADELAKLMKKPLYMVNLIPYNPTNPQFKPSPEKQILKFKKYLESRRMNVTIRHSFGQDIRAACGELANK